MDEARWYFYRDVDDQCPAWPGLLATTNKEKNKLIVIIREMTSVLYGPRSQFIEAHQILTQYSKLANWRDDLPDSLRDLEGNINQALPHVLFLL